MTSQRYESFSEVKVTAGGTVAADDVDVIDNMIGVAKSSAESGDDVMYAVKGVFALTKKAAITPAVGTPVFWDAAPGEITDTAADGVPAGVVWKTPAAGDATVLVAINELAPGDAVADEATADGSDLATTQALANALKDKVNELLASLRASGAIKGA